MSKVNKGLSAVFSRQNQNVNIESQEALLITSSTSTSTVADDQSIHTWEDKSIMTKFFKCFLPYASPVFLIIKYITYFVMFVLGTYVLWQCTEYFKGAKAQQDRIHMELNNFHISAEQKLKQLNILQETMKDELDNINILTEQGSKRIKDLFSFSKSDLLKDYEENTGDQCEFIPLSLRFDCHPENGASELSCADRGCCWNALHQLNYEKQVPLDVPYCYYPKNWSLYRYENFTKDGNDFSGLLSLKGESFYKKDLPLVKIESTGIDDTILRVKV